MRHMYVPYEKMIDHVVAIWQLALINPIYNAGNDGQGLAMAMLQLGKSENNSTKDVLVKFGVELKKLLMTPQPYKHSEGEHYINHLRVDYDPDDILRQAAEKAGLKTSFPVKTDMSINNTCISFSLGYGEQDDYHYPLNDGRWLVTKLRGDDMSVILNHLNDGTPLSFRFFEKEAT